MDAGHMLSAFCHCSGPCLSRIFKRRMELAKDPLCLSNERIAEIAAGVGLGDPNYFSRVFMQITGVPPAEFRKRLHQGDS